MSPRSRLLPLHNRFLFPLNHDDGRKGKTWFLEIRLRFIASHRNNLREFVGYFLNKTWNVWSHVRSHSYKDAKSGFPTKPKPCSLSWREWMGNPPANRQQFQWLGGPTEASVHLNSNPCRMPNKLFGGNFASWHAVSLQTLNPWL